MEPVRWNTDKTQTGIDVNGNGELGAIVVVFMNISQELH